MEQSPGPSAPAVMAFNIANEYLALDRDVPLTRLPTVMSYTARLGVDDQIISEQTSRLAWGPYLREQVSRIGRMSTPYFVEQRRRGRPLSLDIPGLSFAQQETGDAGHLPLQRAALPLLAGLTGGVRDGGERGGTVLHAAQAIDSNAAVGRVVLGDPYADVRRHTRVRDVVPYRNDSCLLYIWPAIGALASSAGVGHRGIGGGCGRGVRSFEFRDEQCWARGGGRLDSRKR